MKLPKDRLELVIKPRCGVWKATTSYAPGFRPELAPPRGGMALGSVSAFALWNPTQAAEPPGRGVAWNPILGARLPLVKFALYLQMSLPILTMVPRNHTLLLGRSTCSELQGNWRAEGSGSSRWWWGLLLCVLENARSILPKGTWVWVPESTVACSLLYGGSKVPLWHACPLSPTCRTRAVSLPKPESVVSSALSFPFCRLEGLGLDAWSGSTRCGPPPSSSPHPAFAAEDRV